MAERSGLKILVVDDDAAIRKFLRISIEASGYEVIEARTGERALANAATETPALVLLDLGLPDLDGHEVVTRLRDWFRGPILILSVRAGETEKVAALDAGADDYVVMPFGVQAAGEAAPGVSPEDTARSFSALMFGLRVLARTRPNASRWRARPGPSWPCCTTLPPTKRRRPAERRRIRPSPARTCRAC